MPLCQLVYTSEATVPFDDAGLDAVLRHARRWNFDHGLTGLLLHCDGRIMQVLEGEEEELRPLLGRIAADLRHRNLVLLADGPIAQRAFPDWSMGFAPLDPAAHERLSGFLDLRAPLALPVRSLHADPALREVLRDFVH